MGKYQDLTGRKFGKLTVIARGKYKYGQITWQCKCDCGELTEVAGHSLRAGRTTSCKCYMRQRHVTHGLTCSGYSRKALNCWVDMKRRCNNPNFAGYPGYGGRGITVDPEWDASYAAFIRDMGMPLKGMLLDRIDNDGPYCKANCRWVDAKTSMGNRRCTIWVEHQGERKCLKEVTDLLGLKYDKIKARIRRLGWDPQRAITTP